MSCGILDKSVAPTRHLSANECKASISVKEHKFVESSQLSKLPRTEVRKTLVFLQTGPQKSTVLQNTVHAGLILTLAMSSRLVVVSLFISKTS